MLKFACICFAIAATTPLWSQVEPSATGGGFSLDDDHMMTPPPVSRDAYPVAVGAESRSNYLAGGIVFTGSYQDNLLLGNSSGAVSDEEYSFVPSISFDRRTPRQGESLSYSTGFNLFQKTSELNGITQDASASYRFHLSPYALLTFSDSFSQNYNLYNRGNPFSGGGVSGSPGSTNNILIAPFANELMNATTGALNYQYGRNAMAGVSGTYSFLNYSQLSDVPGLDNADASEGTAFMTRRIARSQYLGVTYQISKFVTHPLATYTLSHTVFGFYTHYFTQSFSISVLGGPEHYTSWAPTVAKQGKWTPAIQGSMGWQTMRASISASASRIVSGAGGLVGTYHANMAGLSARMSIARRWGVGTHLDYSMFKSVNSNPVFSGFGAGGHTITGGVFIQHQLYEHMHAEAGYQHFHQGYGGIAAANTFPDSNRAYVSVSYQFNRPIGR